MTVSSERGLPARLCQLLDGEHLSGPEHAAFVLAACDPEGWSHTALLSVGEVLAVSARELRLALHRGSGTTASLTASGRGTLLVVHGGAAWTVRLAARRAPDPVEESLPARFVAEVREVRRHTVPYAELTSPIAFRLLDPEATQRRWRTTLSALRELGAGNGCA